MSRLRFRDATVWKYSIVAISKIIEEAAFVINEDGLRLKAIDPSSTILVDFYIPSSAFSEYALEGAEHVISVNMEDLARILKRAGKNDELVLSVTEISKLGVILEGRGSRKFVLPALESRAEEMPEIEFEIAFSGAMLSSMFKQIVKEMKPISDVIEFEANSEDQKLYVRATGEIANAEHEIDLASGVLIEYELKNSARSKYSSEYLADIATAAPAAENVRIGFGDETPILIDFVLPYGGSLKFYVAPRGD